jgi:hypothetical protein
MNNEKWREIALIFILNQRWQCYEVPTRRLNSPKPNGTGRFDNIEIAMLIDGAIA